MAFLDFSVSCRVMEGGMLTTATLPAVMVKSVFTGSVVNLGTD